MPYTEDTLVQQTTAEYLEQKLGWQSVYAYNNEDFGPNSLLGRASDREVVLTRPCARNLPNSIPDCLTRHTTTQCVRLWQRRPCSRLSPITVKNTIFFRA